VADRLAQLNESFELHSRTVRRGSNDIISPRSPSLGAASNATTVKQLIFPEQPASVADRLAMLNRSFEQHSRNIRRGSDDYSARSPSFGSIPSVTEPRELILPEQTPVPSPSVADRLAQLNRTYEQHVQTVRRASDDLTTPRSPSFSSAAYNSVPKQLYLLERSNTTEDLTAPKQLDFDANEESGPVMRLWLAQRRQNPAHCRRLSDIDREYSDCDIDCSCVMATDEENLDNLRLRVFT